MAARNGVAKASNQVVAKNLDLNALSKAGQAMDRGGLTKAGRALDKHGGRPGSVFPKLTGNPFFKNTQGQYHLDNILTDPKSFIISHRDKGFKIYSPDGKGARFDAKGLLRGFVEFEFE